MTAVLKRHDEIVLVFWKHACKDRKVIRFYLPGNAVVGHAAPERPTARATIAAVAGASPVTMIARTPKQFNSETSAADR